MDIIEYQVRQHHTKYVTVCLTVLLIGTYRCGTTFNIIIIDNNVY